MSGAILETMESQNLILASDAPNALVEAVPEHLGSEKPL